MNTMTKAGSPVPPDEISPAVQHELTQVHEAVTHQSPLEKHNEQRARIRKMLSDFDGRVDAIEERLQELSASPDQGLILDYIEAQVRSAHRNLTVARIASARLDALPHFLVSDFDPAPLVKVGVIFVQDLVVYGMRRAMGEGLISARVKTELEIALLRSGS